MAKRTALQLCQSAYRQAQVGELTAFGSNVEPFNMAVDLLNTVIAELNRKPDMWFVRTSTTLTYSASATNHIYDLTALSIDPRRITRIYRTLVQTGDVQRMNWERFHQAYRRSIPALDAGIPNHFAIFSDELEFDRQHDQDYGLTVEHYADMPKVTTESETLSIPENDEDVVIDGVLAYLKQRLAMPDADSYLSLWLKKLEEIRYNAKQDSGIHFIRPARF